MFRSWGELSSSADAVFDLFAEPPRFTVSPLGEAVAPQDVTAAAEAEVGLGRVGLECAFFVLFGRHPTPSLLDDCIAAAPPRRSPSPPTAPPLPHPRRRCFVTRAAFRRLVVLCAEAEGDGFVLDAQTLEDGDVGITAAPSHRARSTSAALAHRWALFDSVAGAKGYISAADLSNVRLQGPFADVQETLAKAVSTAAAPQRQEPHHTPPLLQHVFWMLDTDHDGRVRFDDVRPYLQGR
ncbi:hypothetical protein NESM_000190500 [Novymonas esmeraldas]|uniref:EF-hand domain-containing protein n=1 Tax=Novymonas esmeraldas TaxID=1808958 RepID=A0AAW0F642_9TRYP